MSTTRYAKTSADPDASNERFLASSKLRGIQIGLNVVCRIGRVRPLKEARAMIWTVNYARLKNLTADMLSDELDLSRADIRTALTDPEADLSRFMRQVALVREKFEAALPAMQPTEPTTLVREAFAHALEEHDIVECIGRNRMGKTDTAEIEYWRNFDRAVWLTCPDDESDKTFLFDLAAACGISAGTSKKACQLRPQVLALFRTGLIDLLIVDEAHFLWPADLSRKPKRIEFLRNGINADGKVGVLVLATPQYSESALTATSHTRWAPGQWDGRVIRYHFRDTMSEADLELVARHHAPDFTDDMIGLLTLQAAAGQGFCGLMVNTIRLARRKARIALGLPKDSPVAVAVSEQQLMAAIDQQARSTRVDQIANAAAPAPAPRRRTKKAVELPVDRMNGAALPPATTVFTGPTTVRVS